MDTLQPGESLIYVDLDEEGQPLDSDAAEMGAWVTLEDNHGKLLLPASTSLGQEALRLVNRYLPPLRKEDIGSMAINRVPSVAREVASNPNNHASSLADESRDEVLRRVRALLAA